MVAAGIMFNERPGRFGSRLGIPRHLSPYSRAVSKTKILAIKFKYLGDVVVVVPALRALRDQWPDAELHALVAEDAAPLLRHLPWLDKVWALPRTRGQARLAESWPIIRALRREKFDRSVDFVGNDRGAILSRLIGARERLGVVARWTARPRPPPRLHPPHRGSRPHPP